ncbi:hypothetical protein SGGMMB4_01128 [Sodalis glossinidius str. 'morsitans']|nr:hypothetical protein SGGMMB4_01128 [Sodalis glossinidius str. 'morsitans']
MNIISSRPLGTLLNRGFALNSRRIARIIHARMLEDASHMELVDRLFDKFLRQGGKRTAIARLYRQISQPGAGEPRDLSPVTMVARFMQLRAFADGEYRGVFQLALLYDRWNRHCGLICYKSVIIGSINRRLWITVWNISLLKFAR